MKRVIWRSVTVFTLLIAILIGVLISAIYTERGSQTLWSVAQSAVGKDFDLGELNGTLISPFRIRGFSINNVAQVLAIETIEVEWDLRKLLERQLYINNIAVNKLDYQRQTVTEKPSAVPFKLDQLLLPVTIQVDQATLTELSIKTMPEAEPVVAEKLQFGFTLDKQMLALNDATLNSALLDLKTSAQVDLLDGATNGKATWHARVTEYAASKGEASIGGSLKNLQINILSAAPYSLTANLQIENLLNQPNSKIAIDNINISLSAIGDNLPAVNMQGFAKVQSPKPGGAIQFQTALALTNLPQIGSAKTALSGNFADNRIRIDQWRLSPDNDTTEINGLGEVLLSPQSDIQFDFDWQQLRWPLKGITLFESPSGKAKVTGTFESLEIAFTSAIDVPASAKQIEGGIKLDLSTPQPTIEATLLASSFNYPNQANPLLSNAQLDVSVSGQLPVLQAVVNMSLPGIDTQPHLSSRASIDLTNAQEPVLDIKGDWGNLQWPFIAAEEADILLRSQLGEFTVSGTPQTFSTQFKAHINGHGRVEGEAAYAPDNVALETQWSDIVYQTAEQLVHSDNGKLQVAGTPDNYQIGFDGELMVDDKSLNLKATGQGNRQSIAIDQFTALLLDGEVNGDVQFQWSPQMKGQVKLRSQNIDPGLWWPQWPGRINGPLFATANVSDGVVSVENFDAKLQGELRAYPLDLELIASTHDREISIELLSFKSGETTINAQGQLSDQLDFNWDLTSTNLTSIHPQLSGEINAAGAITGQPDKPVIQADVDGDAIAYGTSQINDLVARVFLDTTDTENSDINLQFAGRVADIDIHNALLTAKGLTRKHQVVLSTDTAAGSLTARGDSRFSQKLDWEFSLNEADIDTSQWGFWTLASPVSGALRQQNLSISSACFNSNEAELCAETEIKDSNLLANTRFSKLALSAFIAPYTTDFKLTGTVSGSGTVKLTPGNDPIGNVRITNTAGELLNTTNKELSADLQRLLVFEPGILSMELAEGQVNAELNLPLAGDDALKAALTLSGTSSDWFSRSLRGNIDTQITKIDFIEQMIPGADKIRGSIKGAMTVQGTLAKPRFNGTFGLHDGSVELAGPEIQLEKIHITLDGDPQTGMLLNGSALSGGGELSLSGRVDLSNGTPVADIKLHGESVQISNTAQAEVYVSPNLTLKLSEKKISVAGEVIIPTATIEIKSVPRSAIKVSSDQIIISDKVDDISSSTDYQLSARVKTRLGDDVNFSGFGLTGRLGGELTSVEQPDKSSQINGEIEILDGRYQAYGQNLTIETGRLLFAGEGSTNPALDLRASRQPTREVKVGVTARGNLQQPDFSLYSTPAMTERNKLSYLILGRASDQTSTGEKSQLGQLALALGLKRSSGITTSIGETLGVDQIGVEAEPGSTAEQESFVIGKYLTPKLYLRYGIGLFEPINTLRLQYSINEHWKIVTESSDKASSGDIQYSIDR